MIENIKIMEIVQVVDLVIDVALSCKYPVNKGTTVEGEDALIVAIDIQKLNNDDYSNKDFCLRLKKSECEQVDELFDVSKLCHIFDSGYDKNELIIMDMMTFENVVPENIRSQCYFVDSSTIDEILNELREDVVADGIVVNNGDIVGYINFSYDLQDYIDSQNWTSEY